MRPQLRSPIFPQNSRNMLCVRSEGSGAQVLRRLAHRLPVAHEDRKPNAGLRPLAAARPRPRLPSLPPTASCPRSRCSFFLLRTPPLFFEGSLCLVALLCPISLQLTDVTSRFVAPRPLGMASNYPTESALAFQAPGFVDEVLVSAPPRLLWL